jgi:hypothetical protein
MEKCPNCGAAVRPGAKFCTSCGTRLNDEPAAPAPSSWSQTGSSEETMVATPAVEPETPTESPSEPETGTDPFATWNQGGGGWGSPQESTPADRFEAALDADTEPETAGDASTGDRPETSDEDRFASWAAAYGSYQETATETSDTAATDASTGTAEEHDESLPEDEASRAWAAAGTSTSSPAPREATDESSVSSPEARQRATELVDELRKLIWKIGIDENGTSQDETLAVIVLAGARGQTAEFSDLARALDALKEDPRDIDALRDFGAKADRFGELLESHGRLLAAIDEALRELR